MLEHYGAACRVIARLMPWALRSRYDAEDFVSEAIVDLMKNPTAYTGRNTLILIARRRMIDAARSRSSTKNGGNLGGWI
jgi:DNA-directed RNA polymerase specialized sigma24 family protein